MEKYRFNKKLPLLGLVFLGGLIYLLTQSAFSQAKTQTSGGSAIKESAQTVLDCGPKAEGESLAAVTNQVQNPECLFIGCGGFF